MSYARTRQTRASEMSYPTRARRWATIRDAFWSKVYKSEDCWLWLAAISEQGSARLGFGGRTYNHAHRLAWEWENGPLEPGRRLRHTCPNVHCVRPSHMRSLTLTEMSLEDARTRLGDDYEFPWSRITKGDGCWLWTGATAMGYGKFGRNGDGPVSAHRAAWINVFGPIPAGLMVLHHCDNKLCVKTEPDEQWPEGHLFLGTALDNMRDMIAKGRAAWQQTS